MTERQLTRLQLAYDELIKPMDAIDENEGLVISGTGINDAGIQEIWNRANEEIVELMYRRLYEAAKGYVAVYEEEFGNAKDA